tara:strand:+ start:3005 stop:3397 length:393 start_codon:yes stop_codon:yes gene_type:complete
MKNVGVLALIISFLALQSCCKNKAPLSIPAIGVEYINLTGSVLLYDIEIDRNDISQVIDTTQVYLSESNKHFYLFEFKEGENTHILFISDSTSIDTLSNFSFNKDKCDVIESFGYKHNGINKSDSELIIQ